MAGHPELRVGRVALRVVEPAQDLGQHHRVDGRVDLVKQQHASRRQDLRDHRVEFYEVTRAGALEIERHWHLKIVVDEQEEGTARTPLGDLDLLDAQIDARDLAIEQLQLRRELRIVLHHLGVGHFGALDQHVRDHGRDAFPDSRRLRVLQLVKGRDYARVRPEDRLQRRPEGTEAERLRGLDRAVLAAMEQCPTLAGALRPVEQRFPDDPPLLTAGAADLQLVAIPAHRCARVVRTGQVDETAELDGEARRLTQGIGVVEAVQHDPLRRRRGERVQEEVGQKSNDLQHGRLAGGIGAEDRDGLWDALLGALPHRREAAWDVGHARRNPQIDDLGLADRIEVLDLDTV